MLHPILGGCLLGAVCFVLAAGFGSACGSPRLMDCRTGAAADLPLEPEWITLADARELSRRLSECQALSDPTNDGGSP